MITYSVNMEHMKNANIRNIQSRLSILSQKNLGKIWKKEQFFEGDEEEGENQLARIA